MFFNSVNHDRVYEAQDFANYFNRLISDGIITTQRTDSMQVFADTGMDIKINQGAAYVDGYMAISDGTDILTLQIANNTYDRIDTVVLELNHAERRFNFKIVMGTPSENPQPTAPVRNSTVYQLILAEIRIPKNATAITQALITDTRADTEKCGICTNLLGSIDTTNLFSQYQAEWDLLMQSFSGDEQAIIAAYDSLNRIRPLEIGGTNLITNSLFNGRTGWGCADTTTLVMTDNIAKITPSSRSGTGVYATITKIYGDTAADYIFSFTAKADTARQIIVALTGFSADGATVYTSAYTTLTLSAEWQHFKATFKCDKNNVVKFSLSIMSSPANTTPFYLKYPKLERGTEVTDWTPSPYDLPACVQCGTVTLTPSSNKQVPVNVQFATPYRIVPMITVSSSGYQTGSDLTGNTPIVYNKTTTGFTISSQYASTVTIDWVAVGERGTL